MKKKKATPIEVYVLKSLKASKHSHRSEDKSLRQFLTEHRFSDIVPLEGSAYVTATGGTGSDPIFLVEIERDKKSSQLTYPFFIIRLDGKSRTVVDTGMTIHIFPRPIVPGEVEVYARGDEIPDWTLVLAPASIELMGRNQELKDRPFTPSGVPDAPELPVFSKEDIERMKGESRRSKTELPEKDAPPVSVDDPHVQSELRKIVGVKQVHWHRPRKRRGSQGTIPCGVSAPSPAVSEPMKALPVPGRPEFPGSSIVFSYLSHLESAVAAVAAVTPATWENVIRAEMKKRNLSGVEGINAATHIVTDRLAQIRSSLETARSAVGFVKRNLLHPKNPV